jgi:hypothetical protein
MQADARTIASTGMVWLCQVVVDGRCVVVWRTVCVSWSAVEGPCGAAALQRGHGSACSDHHRRSAVAVTTNHPMVGVHKPGLQACQRQAFTAFVAWRAGSAKPVCQLYLQAAGRVCSVGTCCKSYGCFGHSGHRRHSCQHNCWCACSNTAACDTQPKWVVLCQAQAVWAVGYCAARPGCCNALQRDVRGSWSGWCVCVCISTQLLAWECRAAGMLLRHQPPLVGVLRIFVVLTCGLHTWVHGHMVLQCLQPAGARTCHAQLHCGG